MYSSFPDLFKCIKCNSSFENSKIQTDNLICSCGKVYPIFESSINFLDSNSNAYSIGNLEKIDQSFSQQWKMFDYDNKDFKTWDWDIRSRLIQFFKEMSIRHQTLNNKLLLDAGCGNGVLTSWLSLFGCKTVGIDISDSIFRANIQSRKILRNDNRPVFVKGSLTNPPFQEKTFDYIYSSGVLHHNKNTREVLSVLCPLLQDDGRIYVWLYSENMINFLFVRPFRKITTKLPLDLLHGLTYMLAFPFSILRSVSSFLGLRKYVKKSVDELQLSIHDTFSPTYAHHHTEKELIDWFNELGFTKSKVTFRSRIGFGILASRTNLEP